MYFYKYFHKQHTRYGENKNNGEHKKKKNYSQLS